MRLRLVNETANAKVCSNMSVRSLITATACSMACLSRIGSSCQPFRTIYSPRRLCRSLHWLLMRQRIDNKFANRTFKARQLLCVCVTLESSLCNILYHPAVKANFESKTFRVVVPTVWKSFHYELLLRLSLDSFKSQQLVVAIEHDT